MYLNEDDESLNNTQTSSVSKNTSKDKKKDNYKSDVDKTIEEGDKLIFVKGYYKKSFKQQN